MSIFTHPLSLHLQSGYVPNQEWFKDMVDACMNYKNGVTCGIVSAPDQWKYILGELGLLMLLILIVMIVIVLGTEGVS